MCASANPPRPEDGCRRSFADYPPETHRTGARTYAKAAAAELPLLGSCLVNPGGLLSNLDGDTAADPYTVMVDAL